MSITRMNRHYHQDVFHEICKHARNLDAKNLKKCLEYNQVAISLRIGQYTPVTVLAEEGSDLAVTFLLDEFDAYETDAVLGYAYAGRTEEVERMFKRDGRADDVDMAAYGYARKGLVDEVNQMIERGADWNRAAHGYAEAGFIDLAESYIPKMDEIDVIIFGYKRAGLIERAKQLLVKEDNDPHLDYTDLYVYLNLESEVEKRVSIENQLNHSDKSVISSIVINKAVFGYAAAGLSSKVDDLISRGADNERALYGYMQGYYLTGSVEYLNYIRDHRNRFPAMTALVIELLASIGFVGECNELLNEYGYKNYASFAISGYISAGEHARVNQLLNMDVVRQQEDCIYDNLISGTVRDYDRSGYWGRKQSILKILSHITNAETRNQFFLKMNEDIMRPSFEMLEDAVRINAVMKKNGYNYAQAHAYEQSRGWIPKEKLQLAIPNYHLHREYLEQMAEAAITLQGYGLNLNALRKWQRGPDDFSGAHKSLLITLMTNENMLARDAVKQINGLSSKQAVEMEKALTKPAPVSLLFKQASNPHKVDAQSQRNLRFQ